MVATQPTPRTDAAPGDMIILHRHPFEEWRVEAVWRRVDGEYEEQDWAEIWCPELGSYLIRLGDEAEVLHALPRPCGSH